MTMPLIFIGTNRSLNEAKKGIGNYMEKRENRKSMEKKGYRGSQEQKSYKGSQEQKSYKGSQEKKGLKSSPERKYYKDSQEKRGLKGGQRLVLDQRQKPWQDDEANEFHELDIIEGRNPVIEAIKSGRSINKILVSKGDKEGSINFLVAIASEKKIVVQEVERAKLDMLSITGAHQGVIAYVSPKDYVELEDILKIAEDKGQQPFILILDGITDTQNLGAILRTADAAGVHGVVIPKRRAIGLTAAVAKASAGAIEYVPVARVTNISQTIEYLKEKNIWAVGTDSSEGNRSFQKCDLKGAIALVIGSEGEGLGRLVKEKCDFVVTIPMKGKISSLNASVAAAVVMYEVLRQRDG